MAKANEMQVGGNHYKTTYEHWDFVINTNIGYFSGNATKYVSRARKKHGEEDLKKALHYVNKMIENKDELFDFVMLPPIVLKVLSAEIDKFSLANQLNAEEREFIWLLVKSETEYDLYEARKLLLGMIPAKPVPLEDSNKHADRVDQETSNGV